uniref:RSN1_TM domain-containing protein n=1 Tax=Steinernema glaseri TaxID=37863 RepID=A0A1I7ZJP4_9BILA
MPDITILVIRGGRTLIGSTVMMTTLGFASFIYTHVRPATNCTSSNSTEEYPLGRNLLNYEFAEDGPDRNAEIMRDIADTPMLFLFLAFATAVPQCMRPMRPVLWEFCFICILGVLIDLLMPVLLVIYAYNCINLGDFPTNFFLPTEMNIVYFVDGKDETYFCDLSANRYNNTLIFYMYCILIICAVWKLFLVFSVHKLAQVVDVPRAQRSNFVRLLQWATAMNVEEARVDRDDYIEDLVDRARWFRRF